MKELGRVRGMSSAQSVGTKQRNFRGGKPQCCFRRDICSLSMEEMKVEMKEGRCDETR